MQRSWSKSLSTRRGSTPANRPEGKGATRYPEVAAITATRTKQPTPKAFQIFTFQLCIPEMGEKFAHCCRFILEQTSCTFEQFWGLLTRLIAINKLIIVL